MLITFSGIDGSGKTSLSKRAKDYLLSRGTNARVSAVYQNSIFLKIGRMTGRISPYLKSELEGKINRASGLKKGFIIFLRKLFLFLDIFVFRASLCLSGIRKTAVICDRYFFDTIAHYLYLEIINEYEASLFLKIIPSPDMSILLTVGENIAKDRERGHDHINYYSVKNAIYNKLCNRLNFIRINTASQEEETWPVIKEKLDNRIYRSILMVSRAVEPPWDEASKNLVRDIVYSLEKHSFGILTTGSAQVTQKENVDAKKIYSSRNQSLSQKLRLCLYLLRNRSNFAIYHFCFTPEPLTSFIMKNIRVKGKSVQNVPYLTGQDLGKLIYADNIVVNSEHTLNILKNKNVKNVNRIYPSIDTDRFNPSIDKALGRNEHDIPAGINVLWAGKLVSDLTADGIRDVVLHTCSKDRSINFVLAVRIDNRKEALRSRLLKKQLYDKGLGNRIRMIHKLEDMAILIASCDMLIYPFFKGFKKKIDIPYVIVEAMACGLPVLVSDAEPLNEAIKDGAGMLVKAMDPASFSGSIVGLCRDKEKAADIGSKNRIVALKYFDLGKNVHEYERIYDSLLREK